VGSAVGEPVGGGVPVGVVVGASEGEGLGAGDSVGVSVGASEGLGLGAGDSVGGTEGEAVLEGAARMSEMLTGGSVGPAGSFRTASAAAKHAAHRTKIVNEDFLNIIIVIIYFLCCCV
jgi:hypothetical protein